MLIVAEASSIQQRETTRFWFVFRRNVNCNRTTFESHTAPPFGHGRGIRWGWGRGRACTLQVLECFSRVPVLFQARPILLLSVRATKPIWPERMPLIIDCWRHIYSTSCSGCLLYLVPRHQETSEGTFGSEHRLQVACVGRNELAKSIASLRFRLNSA